MARGRVVTGSGRGEVSRALDRLGLPDTPVSRALLVLIDDTVSRLDRKGRILGVWVGDRDYVADLDDATIDEFEAATDRYVTDFVGADTRRSILDAIEQCLETGSLTTVEFTTRATGRTLYLRGSCTPCGNDQVMWTSRDRTADHEARRVAERRAELESMLSDGLQALIDAGAAIVDDDDLVTGVFGRVAEFFGADAAFLRRFRGAGHIEIVGQWRGAGVDYSPPGTSRAGSTYFPWAARQLARDPILIVPSLGGLGPEASTDIASLDQGLEGGLVWVRVGSGRRPSGLFGLLFDRQRIVDDRDGFEPLIGFASTTLGLIARAEEELRRTMQRHVLESIVHGDPLPDVLERVCRLREAGSPSHSCVAWLVDDHGRLHPIGGADDRFAGFDPCPDGSPELVAFDRGERCWIDATEQDPGPVARHLGAGAIDLIPLATGSGHSKVGLLAVYDTSRLPLDPTEVGADPHGELAASLASLAVERLTDLAELAHRATHDSLTGLANRETFVSELDRAIAESGPVDRLVAVLYCDIDRFKELNDHLGHGYGDDLLVDVADVLTTNTPDPCVVARLGGDEFAVLLEALSDENDAMIVAERIRTAVRTSPASAGRRATVSIGVAVSGSPTDHAEGLMRDADVAMYQAKSTGRDRVELFAERLRREARARDQMGRELVDALDHGDVDVHFQPMVDLVAGRLMGFEALARWKHPERGFVSPGEFIPVAEAGGMIERLGDVVLERALAVAAHWDGLDLHVNLSAVQIDRPGVVERLLERIIASGIPVERLAMEVTESVLLPGSLSTLENLRVLTDAGVGLVLDDFGTGYASLTYLRSYPFQGIKVDRSFVDGMEHNADDSSIVSMVLALASSLGLEVIAEGVETLGQERMLRDKGCRYVQGYRYSVPVPRDEVGGLIDRFGSGVSSVF
ncbi:MAG: EAL domain-containing protein [Actinobacteria bacterium]|nr:EAL domain-containing protein [Actinomycetota bacterium]